MHEELEKDAVANDLIDQHKMFSDNLEKNQVSLLEPSATIQPQQETVVSKRPVNKHNPDDWLLQADAASIVRKIKKEKQDREMKLQIQQQQKDDKVNKKLFERNQS